MESLNRLIALLGDCDVRPYDCFRASLGHINNKMLKKYFQISNAASVSKGLI